MEAGMRKTATIALAGTLALYTAPQLAAQAECRGQTLSELNACVAAQNPQVETQPQSLLVSPRTSRRELGGVLQPTDLRTDVRAQAPRAGVVRGGVLADDAREITAPELYGLPRDVSSEYYEVEGRIVRVDRTTRQILNASPADASEESGIPEP
jgi:hypothetical protein